MNDAREKSRQALVSLAREAAEQVDGAVLTHGLERVRQKLAKKPRASAVRPAAWLAVGVVVLALLFAVWGPLRFASSLSYRVSGAEVERAGYVSGQAALDFSDGSRLRLDEHARARVMSVDDKGAQVELEDGVLHADIVHRAVTRWRFEAGPFSIHVRGTSFALEWSGAEGRLDVRLRSGLLEIHTPFSQAPVLLHAGQRLLATLHDRQVIVRELDEPPLALATANALPAPSVTSAVEPPELVARAVASTASATPTTEARPSWASLMASGQWRVILDEAEQQGTDAALAKRSSDELALLAAAARYGSRAELARRALVAQRERFASSTHAKDAAFLLGRLDEGANARAALSWYDRYLTEAPSGAYAAEATGRKMLTTRRLLGDPSARPIAESYLRRWPKGPHANTARALLERP